MKKFTPALLAAVAVAAFQISVAPAASANTCPAAGEGSYPNRIDCPLGSIAAADAIDEARQRAEGRPPCYTREGVPYYTPGDAPCG
ncbi:hypothetical protein [Mycobacterium asiaticum]|uniref:DUF3761 domain-containing protein n=1 Tax=Mycobacterium asiaticum TaxID=1790 RepID=A0A1A3HK84_MYCAS|nr:hypothetical protein [Mycobacterium asiaticum]OBJ48550.1 hypothetical protein A9W94_04025 [Mycobacterium asiaticum]OBJ84208.1 hypothetical protein A5640_15795 [Mycobacterium asiaticum]ORA17473.1 hypothetical protein BST16_04075 [Mycobacterium asiaticum DSM 44297]